MILTFHRRILEVLTCMMFEKNGHTMLNVTSVNNSGINGYYVYEATTKDNLDKCIFNFQDSA